MADDQPPVSDSTPTPDASAPVPEPPTPAETPFAAHESQAPPAGQLDPSPADQATIDELLKQASFEDPATALPASASAPAVAPFDLPNFQQVMQDAQVSSIELLRDVELNV